MRKTKPLHSANISLTKRLLMLRGGFIVPGFQKMIFAVAARAALMRSAGAQQTCVPMRPPET